MTTVALADFAAAPSPAAPGWGPRLAAALRRLHTFSPALSRAGWLHLALAGLALVLLPLDHRHVTGAPVWLKPLKFALSGLAYTWTLAWLLASLPAAAQRSARRLGRVPGAARGGRPMRSSRG